MGQQFDYPKTETELREIQDKLYQQSKEVFDAGGRPAFKGLLEIMSAEATIVTAIHNIKSNHGSETPGVDGKRMRRDYLEKPFSWVIADIQKAFRHYEAQEIRRKYIDKPGKAEKRPLIGVVAARVIVSPKLILNATTPPPSRISSLLTSQPVRIVASRRKNAWRWFDIYLFIRIILFS